MIRRFVPRMPLLAILLVGAWTPGTADRIHVESGGIIEVDSWWIDSGTLYYRAPHGTIGLPRSIVLRIESADPPAGEAETTTIPRTPPARRAPPHDLANDVAERMNEANLALQQGDYVTASSLYRALIDTTDGDFLEPRVGYAVSQIALGEDDMATTVVLDALARHPEQPALLELRGDLRNREERVEDALRSWREAFRQAPNDRLRDKMLKAERELEVGRDYALATSSHFNLRYDGQVDLDLADAVTEFLEERYWTLADTFDLAPRQPITVVLYPKQEFRDVTQLPEWVGGVYDGKVRVPIGGLRRLDPAARRLLTHELTHVFVHAKTRGHAPRWLHEGLAQHLAGRGLSRRDRQGILERLRESAPSEWEARGFSYPIALSLTSYLVQRSGFHQLLQVMSLVGDGAGLDESLRAIYGAGYASLCRDWARSVTEEAGP